MGVEIIAIAGAVISAVSAIGGLIQGNSASAKNAQIADTQEKDFQTVKDAAQKLMASVDEGKYKRMATEDIQGAMSDVANAANSRGLGQSSLANTAALRTAADIRTKYGQMYLQDQNQTAGQGASLLAGVASAPRLGYDQDPYAGFRSGTSGLATALANYGNKK